MGESPLFFVSLMILFYYNFYVNQQVKNVHRFPGHMKKAIQQIEDKLKVVDFVVELLDARIPLSSQNEYIEKILAKKPRLFVLTKKDMADDTQTQKWVEFFTKEGNKAIAVDLKNRNDFDLIFKKIMEFCKVKDEKMAKKGIKNISTRAMIVGIPNVGKSTLINYLAKKSIVDVANKPGLTKNVRRVKINNIELLDTPGILQPQYEDKKKAINLAMIGSMNQNILPKDQIAEKCFDFLKESYESSLEKRYSLPNKDLELFEFLEFLAFKRGLLLKNGEPDIEKSTEIFLNEFKNGIICKFTIERL